jgi:hypothetical protein
MLPSLKGLVTELTNLLKATSEVWLRTWAHNLRRDSFAEQRNQELILLIKLILLKKERRLVAFVASED